MTVFTKFFQALDTIKQFKQYRDSEFQVQNRHDYKLAGQYHSKAKQELQQFKQLSQDVTTRSFILGCVLSYIWLFTQKKDFYL